MIFPPALLFVGPQQDCIQQAAKQIMGSLCAKQGCMVCIECQGVLSKRHRNLLWLSPDPTYTVSDLEQVVKVTSFSLDVEERFFIVFERADLFNQATANGLLKLLEEPPLGYQFILLSLRTDSILPTVKSRCIVEHLSATAQQAVHPLYRFFTAATVDTAADFTKELERHKGLERDVLMLLDELTVFWHDRMLKGFREGLSKESMQAQAIGSLLQAARLRVPIPGNAKIFFKDLYLQVLLKTTKV